jgi:hypothetical protein
MSSLGIAQSWLHSEDGQKRPRYHSSWEGKRDQRKANQAARVKKKKKT